MPNNTFCFNVRETLLNVIDDHILRKNEFVKNPDSDFTRNRKLSLESIIKTTLLFSSSSIDKELLDFFNYDINVATSSAFAWQRGKVCTSLYESIFKNFTSSFSNFKTFKGYRVLGVDGSKIRIPHDSNDFDSYCKALPDSKGYNFLCASFLYDLVNKTFLDVDVRPQRKSNEPAAFIDDDKPFYPMSFRAVKVRLGDGKFQFFATNLDRDDFDIDCIKYLYKMRWNIETSFRDLKHPLCLYSFHGKKRESIIQEIFSKMIMYNFCSFISSQITIENKGKKLDYQINFSKVITICREFFRSNNTSLDIEKLIARYILPVKPNRIFQRMVRRQPNISFNYRVS